MTGFGLGYFSINATIIHIENSERGHVLGEGDGISGRW